MIQDPFETFMCDYWSFMPNDDDYNIFGHAPKWIFHFSKLLSFERQNQFTSFQLKKQLMLSRHVQNKIQSKLKKCFVGKR